MDFDRLCDIILTEMAERDGEHVTVYTGKGLEVLDKVSDEYFTKTYIKRPRIRLPINKELAQSIFQSLSQQLPSQETATRDDAMEYSKSSVVDTIIDKLKEDPTIQRIAADAPLKSRSASGDALGALNARLTDAALNLMAMYKKTGLIAYPKLNQLSDAKGSDANRADISMGATPTKRRGRPAGPPKTQVEPEMVDYPAITAGSMLNLNKIAEQQLKSIHRALSRGVVGKLVNMIIGKLGKGKDKEDIISTITLGVKSPVQNDSLREISVSDIRRSVAVPLMELLIDAGVFEQETRQRPAPKKFIPKGGGAGLGKTEDEIKADVINRARYGGSGEADAHIQAQIDRDYTG